MQDLAYFLPVFMAFVLGVLFYFSTLTRSRIIAFRSFPTPRIGQVQRLSRLMNLLLFSAVVVVVLYSFAPGWYRYIALPIDSLDDPVINATGLLILRLTFVWIIAMEMVTYRQLLIFLSRPRILDDKDRFTHFEHWFLFSKRLLSAGIVFILIGLFVTISSLAAVLLALTSLLVYQLQIRHMDTD